MHCVITCQDRQYIIWEDGAIDILRYCRIDAHEVHILKPYYLYLTTIKYNLDKLLMVS